MNSTSDRPNAISKILSRNDTGETGGHQAGILVPKDPDVLRFFPKIDSTERKNPRVPLSFSDPDGTPWTFNFIYYNNKFFGGTRNEFRLTGMTSFMRHNCLKAGDSVTLHRDERERYSITYERSKEVDLDRIVLTGTWRIVMAKNRF